MAVEVSQRFTQATQRELTRLGKSRVKLVAKRDRLRELLDAVAVEIAELDQQRDVLRNLAPPAGDSTPTRPDDPRLLRGASIRRVGVRVLQERGRPIHYRQWLKLVEDEGYTIAGKRPDAVFLGQVVRSPLVRTTTNKGWYALDSCAESRLTAELHEAEDQLATVAASDASDPKAKHEDVKLYTRAVARLRRELEEAQEATASTQQINHSRSERGE